MPQELSRFSGQYRAVAFNYGGGFEDNPAALTVVAGPGVSGAGTLTVQNGFFTTVDGAKVTPFNTNAPVSIINASGTDTQTPSAVSTNVQNQLYGLTATVTATWTYAHSPGDRVLSGTVGLQEALNYASSKGGGTVILDNAWYAQGGTQAIVAAATVPSGVTIYNIASVGPLQTVSVPLTLAQIQGAYTTPVSVLPAPGAGIAYDVVDAVLNLKYGSAAYSGGGAAALYYGADNSGTIATATWAATDFTSLSANQVHKVAGALATVASSTVLNKGLVYSNATAVFTSGTGGSGVLVVNYRTIGGLS